MIVSALVPRKACDLFFRLLSTLQPTFGETMACPKPWFLLQNNITCPYGRALPLGVTLPGDAGPFLYLCLVWSYVPAVIAVANVVLLLCLRRTKQLLTSVFGAAVLLVSELLFKPLLHGARPGASAPIVDEQNKQRGSCAASCGMPSSASALAGAFLVLVFLDSYRRIALPPQAPPPRANRLAILGVFLTPLAPTETLERRHASALLLAWALALGPVPLSRVALLDCTSAQAMAGVALGAGLCLAAQPPLTWLTDRYASLAETAHCRGYYVHDVLPPGYVRPLAEEGAASTSLTCAGGVVAAASR